MTHKLRNGWVYGIPRDDCRQVHNCLKPYLELSDVNKGKDRHSVRRYPDILKAAHYQIVTSLD